MAIKVRFFASLAESVGRRDACCEFARGMTVLALWRELTGDEALPPGVLCAINHSYCEHDQALDDGDEVAFFPPVTGG